MAWLHRRGTPRGVPALVFTAGAVPLYPEGNLVNADDPARQARQVLANLERRLTEGGATARRLREDHGLCRWRVARASARCLGRRAGLAVRYGSLHADRCNPSRVVRANSSKSKRCGRRSTVMLPTTPVNEARHMARMRRRRGHQFLPWGGHVCASRD